MKHSSHIPPPLRLCLRSVFSLFITCVVLAGGVKMVQADTAAQPSANDIEIDIVAKQSSKPFWKALWDGARQLTKEGQTEQARMAYERLLAFKPNIVVALWEYCRILVELRQWDAAEQSLEKLLELEPDNLEYILAAANTALRNTHHNKARAYFGKVLENSPAGAWSVPAMRGLAQSFEGLGMDKSALLILEQLHQRDTSQHTVAAKLASLSKKLKLGEKARYYFSILAEKHPFESEYLAEAGDAHNVPGYRDKASHYYEKYLEKNPDSLAVRKKLAQCYLDMGRIESGIVHLKKVYLLDNLSSSLALRIADLYFKDLNRPDRALFYYEQYYAAFQDNTTIAATIDRIHKLLARQYLPIVENEAAERLWHDLDIVTSNKRKIFTRIAEIFKERGQYSEHLAVLEFLHNKNPDDLDLAYRLARAFLSLEQRFEAYALLLELEKKSYTNIEYLAVMAQLEVEMKKEEKGLQSFLRYLQHKPTDSTILQQALALAGDLGLIERIDVLGHKLDQFGKDFAPGKMVDLQLAYIEALRKNGLYADAETVYQGLLEQHGGEQQLAATVVLHRAKTLSSQGHMFEAEQILRQNLARNLAPEKAIEKLVVLSLQQKRIAQAKAWLKLLAKRRGIAELDERAAILPEDIHFLSVMLLMADSEYDDAENQIFQHSLFTPNDGELTAFERKSALYLTRIYYFQEEYAKCLTTIQKNEASGNAPLEMRVLRAILDANGVQAGKENSCTLLLERAELFVKYNQHKHALATVEEALHLVPQSIRGLLLKIEILAKLARYEEALEVVKTLPERMLDQEYFVKWQLQLQYQRGNFKEVVRNIPAKVVVHRDEQKDKNQDSLDMYFWKRLLLARALWAESRREEAIEVYDSLLMVPVDTIFLEKMEVAKINFTLPPLKKTFWNTITFTDPSRDDAMEKVMEPEFVTRNIGQPVDDIAASLYGKYKWQQLIKKELSARKAVKDRQLYQAEKEYLSLVDDAPSQESLFDLANIYNRLGLYGKAAEIYEKMKKRGVSYPGLEKYAQMNALKRQPQAGAFIEADSHRGRDGYLNLKKRSYGMEGWLMPANNQQVSIRGFRNRYRKYDGDEELSSRSFLTTYSIFLGESANLNAHFGVDAPVGYGTNEFLYKIELFHRINKELEGYGRFEQGLVEDSYRSIQDSVTHRDLELGGEYHVFPRLFVGGDYRFRMYSDDNNQSRFKMWTQYHLFGEVNQFKVKYSYENVRNIDQNKGRSNDFSNTFASSDNVYWSPGMYWQHMFTMHFKHFFDSNLRWPNPLSYCSIDYSLGYEKDDGLSHLFDLNIFLEITRHLLLKGNFRNENGDGYDGQRAAFSIIYRW